jgi:hypothetical protein
MCILMLYVAYSEKTQQSAGTKEAADLHQNLSNVKRQSSILAFTHQIFSAVHFRMFPCFSR